MEYTFTGLVKYVTGALSMNTVYMWGGLMRPVTSDYISARAAQYPSHYGEQRKALLKALVGKNYYGVDCVGLIKSYYWGGVGSPKYAAAGDVTAEGMLERAKEKGAVASIPEIPGVCVYMRGHIGVYIGNGEVVEATTGAYGEGVVKTKLKGRGWTHWLKCPHIKEEETPVKTERTIGEANVKVGNKWVSSLLVDSVTYVPLREFVDAVKSELTVTWSSEEGAGVKL